jgi:hypothetical protein
MTRAIEPWTFLRSLSRSLEKVIEGNAVDFAARPWLETPQVWDAFSIALNDASLLW